MKHKRNLVVLFLFSLAFVMFGFMVDLGERVPNIWVNIYEITMMTALVFAIISSIYGIILVFLPKKPTKTL